MKNTRTSLRKRKLLKGNRQWLAPCFLASLCLIQSGIYFGLKSDVCSSVPHGIQDILRYNPDEFDILKESMAFRCYLHSTNVKRDFTALPERGIVTSAGSERSLTNAFVNFYILRKVFQVDIPLMIMYWGDDPGDTPREALETFISKTIENLTFLDLSKIPYPHHHIPLQRKGNFIGWKAKAYAIYAAPFKKILFLDSDNLLLGDPIDLFESELFSESGNIFWPDLYCGNTVIQNEMGIPESNTTRQTESGQIMLDRESHQDVLEWVLWLNTRDEFTYKLDYGDKDTYKSAFYLAEKVALFKQIDQGLGLALHTSSQNDNTSRKYNIKGFIQFGLDKEMLFFHRISGHKFELKKEVANLPNAVTTPSCQYFSTNGWNPDIIQEEHVGRLIDSNNCPEYGSHMIHSMATRCGDYDPASAKGTSKLPVIDISKMSSVLSVLKASHEAFILLNDSMKE